jgi:hypothetical protein
MMISKPGIYPNISNEEYHSSNGISNSGIKLLLQCPKKYWYEYLSGKAEKEDKSHFVIGSALHTLILEPHLFSKNFFIMEKVNKRTNEGKEKYQAALENAKGRKIITTEEFEKIQAMVDSVKSEPLHKRIGKGHIEHSLAWDYDGVLLRNRPDFYNDDLIVDIKTTFSYGYHRQAAMAIDGLFELTGKKRELFLLIVVEKTAPYLAAFYALEELDIEQGRREYQKAAALYKECVAKNYWPGYSNKVESIGLPRWAKDKELIEEKMYEYASL